VDLRAGLDALVYREIPSPCRESTPRTPIVSPYPSAIPTELSRLHDRHLNLHSHKNLASYNFHIYNQIQVVPCHYRTEIPQATNGEDDEQK